MTGLKNGLLKLTKMNIYEYRTKLLRRQMTHMEAQRLYENSVLQKSTRLAKKCGAWYHKDYCRNGLKHISKCTSSPVFTRMIKSYYQMDNLATGIDLRKAGIEDTAEVVDDIDDTLLDTIQND